MSLDGCEGLLGVLELGDDRLGNLGALDLGDQLGNERHGFYKRHGLLGVLQLGDERHGLGVESLLKRGLREHA